MKFFERTWVIWLCLFIFAPVGIFLLWKNKKYNVVLRSIITTAFLLLFVSGYIGSYKEKQKIKEQARLERINHEKQIELEKTSMENVEKYLEREDLESAKNLLSNMKSGEAKVLLKEINNVEDPELIKKVILNFTDETFVEFQKNPIVVNAFTNKKLNEILTKKILAVENAKEMREEDKKNKIIMKKLEEEAERLKEKQAKIESFFSVWNGEHKLLTEQIKENMNDPKSYSHAETKYKYNEKKDTLTVIQSYRGKNAFGAMVKNTCILVHTVETRDVISLKCE